MQKAILSLLLILTLNASAQQFSWGHTPQTNDNSASWEVATNGRNLFFSVIVYRGTISYDGQTFQSHTSGNAANREATLLICQQKDGAVRWVQNLWSQVASNASYLDGTIMLRLDADSLGNVYLAGRSAGTTSLAGGTAHSSLSNWPDTPYGLLVKIDSSGAYQWHKTFKNGINSSANVHDLAITHDGQEVYTIVGAGDTLYTEGYSDPLAGDYLLKYSAGGSLLTPTSLVPGASILSSNAQMEMGDQKIFIGHGGSTNNPRMIAVEKSNFTWNSINLADKFHDFKVKNDTLFLSGNDNFGANYIRKHHFGTNTTIWDTRGDSISNPGNAISIDVTENGEVIFQAEVSPTAGWNTTPHFDHTPIPSDYHRSLLFGQLDRQGDLKWYILADSVYVPYPREMVILDDKVLCTGEFNATFSPSSTPAHFGNLVLSPSSSNIYNHEYFVALDLLDAVVASTGLPDTVTVCSGSSLDLHASATGGSGNYNFRWKNGKWIVNDTLSAQTIAYPWTDMMLYIEVSDGFSTSTDSVFVDVPDNFFPLFAFFYAKDSANGYALVPGFGPMDADSVHWDFGDGTTSSEYWPYHEFSTSGQVIVNLYISNICGSSTFTDTLNVCDKSWGMTATTPGNYTANLNWNQIPANRYKIFYRPFGQGNWNRAGSNTNSKTLFPLPPGGYEYYLAVSGPGSQSCVDTFYINCDDFTYSNIVSQTTSMKKGLIKLFNASAGKRKWSFGLSNGMDTTWVHNRWNGVFQDLDPGTYYSLVRDKYGCYSSQVDTFQIMALDTTIIPNLVTIQRPSSNSLRPVWTMIDTTNVDRYQVRVRDITNSTPGTVYATYIVQGASATQFDITNLPPGTYRIDVRARVYGSFQNSVYSNYRARVISANKNEIDSTDRIRVYPTPTSDVLWVDCNAGSQIQLLDLHGRELMILTAKSETNRMDLSEFASGTYLIRIQNMGETSVVRFVKQ